MLKKVCGGLILVGLFTAIFAGLGLISPSATILGGIKNGFILLGVMEGLVLAGWLFYIVFTFGLELLIGYK